MALMHLHIATCIVLGKLLGRSYSIGRVIQSHCYHFSPVCFSSTFCVCGSFTTGLVSMVHLLQMSRKGLYLTLIAVAAANMVILMYFQWPNPVMDVPLKHVAPFSAEAQKLFTKITRHPDQFWLAHSELSHVAVDVRLKDVLEPDRFFYDPRLTLAAYMDELATLGPSEEDHVLPFHWSDWADVTILNDHLDPKNSKVLTCDRLQRKIAHRPDTAYFCKNRDDISDEEAAKLGYSVKEQMPAAVVYDHCKHLHLSFNDIRVFMAKSYVLSYLPKPYRVVILGEDRSTYEFAVSQDKGTDQRLSNSGLIDRLVLRAGKKAQLIVKSGGTFAVNHLKTYANLQRAVKLRVVTPEDDVHLMHRVVTSPPTSPKDLSLTERMFSYPPEMIQKQIIEYEKKEKLTLAEQNFFDGLKDCAQYDKTTEPVYFKMATLNIRENKNSHNDWGWHYDWRFFSDALLFEKTGWTKEERVVRTNIILERLLRNWNRFAESKGLVSWIMHGPLLLWYWDGLMFPFDVDIDIQMPITELVRLSKLYNQTLVVEDPTEGYGRFLVDVGTYIHNRDILGTGNHIDARFVDVDSGIYIDITGLAKSPANLPDDYKKAGILQKNDNDAEAEVYNDRRKHFYTFEQLLPLHYSQMGGVPLYVPNQIESRLRFEYSKGLVDYEYHGWYFVPKLQLWVTVDKLAKVLPEEATHFEGKRNRELVIAATIAMTDEQALAMLEDDETLMEYYLTHRLTGLHTEEKKYLFDKEGKDNLKALKDPEFQAKYAALTGHIQMLKPLHKCLFEYERFDRVNH